MKIDWVQLSRLSVLTESGVKLGVVTGVTINTDSHTIDKYEVSGRSFLFGMSKRPILISPTQVISISDKAMIVKNNVVEAEMITNKKTRLAFESPSPEIELSETD